VTKRDRKLLAKYIRQAADHMALGDWTFELKPEPSDPGTCAMCWPVYGQRHASLAFAANFRSMDPDIQRGTVVHELIHCHLAPLQSQVEDDIEDYLGRSATLYLQAVRRNIEYAVDGLERAIAQHLPYIAWP
jgi:hypothetical protein